MRLTLTLVRPRRTGTAPGGGTDPISGRAPSAFVLPERVFLIGGILCLAVGGPWAIVGIPVAEATGDISILLGGALLFGFGAFFVHVGRQARRDRRRLLAEAFEPP